MKTTERSSEYAMVRFWKRLRLKASDIHLDENGLPVVSALFYSRLNVPAVSENFPTVIIENTIVLRFKEMKDKDWTKKVEIFILDGLTSNGLPTQNFFRWDRSEKCLGMHIMYMSVFFRSFLSRRKFSRFTVKLVSFQQFSFYKSSRNSCN